jgi:hypothetical protein
MALGFGGKNVFTFAAINLILETTANHIHGKEKKFQKQE